MSTTTTNLNLIKPAGTDFVNIADFNSNFDIIDAKFGNFNGTVKNINDSVTSLTNNKQNILKHKEIQITTDAWANAQLNGISNDHTVVDIRQKSGTTVFNGALCHYTWGTAQMVHFVPGDGGSGGNITGKIVVSYFEN